MTSESLLFGARQKLDRAYKHVADFQDALSAFFREGPYNTTTYTDPQGTEFVQVSLTGPLPTDLICTVGDAIHNLRSVLDHIAFAAAIANGISGRKALRGVYFTIRNTRKEFEDALCEREVRQIGADWIAFLKSLEPYHGGHGHDLCRIKTLDDLDKHRELIAVATYADIFAWEERRGQMELMGSVPLVKGAEVGIGIRSDDAQRPFLRPNVTFADVGDGTTGRGPAAEDLMRFSETVKRVLDEAARLSFF